MDRLPGNGCCTLQPLGIVNGGFHVCSHLQMSEGKNSTLSKNRLAFIQTSSPSSLISFWRYERRKKFLGFRTRRKNKRSTPGVRLFEPRTEEVAPKQRHCPSGLSIRTSRKLEFSSLGGLRGPLTSNLVPCSVGRRESGLWLAEGTGTESLNTQVPRLGAWVGGVQDSVQVISLRKASVFSCGKWTDWTLVLASSDLQYMRNLLGIQGEAQDPDLGRGFPSRTSAAQTQHPKLAPLRAEAGSPISQAAPPLGRFLLLHLLPLPPVQAKPPHLLSLPPPASSVHL